MNSESETARITPGVLGGGPGQKVKKLEEKQERGLDKGEGRSSPKETPSFAETAARCQGPTDFSCPSF